MRRKIKLDMLLLFRINLPKKEDRLKTGNGYEQKIKAKYHWL